MVSHQLKDAESWEEINLRKAANISKFFLVDVICWSFNRFFRT